MKKNSNLFKIQEVAQYFGLSVQSIRRRIKEAKQNKSSFPRPVFGYNRKALWRRPEIESWNELEPK